MRAILSGVWLAADVPKAREDAIETLVDAMHEINALAKMAPPDPVKGSGGTSPRERWYRVMAYIIQVMDGVCKNVEISELNERLRLQDEAARIGTSVSAYVRAALIMAFAWGWEGRKLGCTTHRGTPQS
jgi:hypothetical protein